MGLLDGSLSPEDAGQLALIGGLLSPGSFGQGLSRGIAGQQAVGMNAADLQLKRAQLATALQEQQVRDVALQQSRRMFDLQTPFLEEAVRRMQGQSSPVAGAQAAMGQGAQAGSVGPTMDNAQRMNAPQQSAPQSGSMFPGVPDNVAFGMIGTGGFSKMPETISKFNEPPDITKLLTAAGIDPKSALGQQLIQQKIAKENYQAPLNARPGSIIRDPYNPEKVLAFNPHVPDGADPLFDASGHVTAFNPIAGAQQIMGGNAQAVEAGKGNVLPYAGFTPSGPAPLTNRTAAATGAQAAVGRAESDRRPILEAELARATDPNDRAAISRELARLPQSARAVGASPLYGAPSLGAERNADLNAKEISDKWKSQVEAHQQAQTTNSYLDNIEQVAKQAKAGPFSDRVAFANALAAPFVTAADQSLTAKQLLDKYANQITARLGQGGLATDAARNLIAAAYPNSKMTPDAIAEAAGNLRGANKMIQARTELLRPIAAQRTPEANAAYDAAATKFDELADPRLFQLKSMDPLSAQKYIKALPDSVRADLVRRAGALKQMGVL